MQKIFTLFVYISTYEVVSKQYETKEIVQEEIVASHSDRVHYKYIVPIGPYTNNVEKASKKNGYPDSEEFLPQHLLKQGNQALLENNPLLSAFLLSSYLQLPPKYSAPNHPELPPVNPFIALLLSQYGRYVPVHGAGKGIYAYQASNDIHNNRPFGSYKIYKDN